MALIAVFATVAVPGPVGSWVPSPNGTPSADLFASVEMAAYVRGSATTTKPLDPRFRSDGVMDQHSTMFEPTHATEPTKVRAPIRPPQVEADSVARNPWHLDRNVSWYGPGFYGKRTACGLAMTERLVGVAHKSLPCGTLITFRNPANGRVVTAPVVDRGPYVAGRQWDLTGGLCLKLDHCQTGTLSWRYASPR
jgi:rare lipoprotein A (peptidoglycan hydrolase)